MENDITSTAYYPPKRCKKCGARIKREIAIDFDETPRGDFRKPKRNDKPTGCY